jgi:hypothetical protein
MSEIIQAYGWWLVVLIVVLIWSSFCYMCGETRGFERGYKEGLEQGDKESARLLKRLGGK